MCAIYLHVAENLKGVKWILSFQSYQFLVCSSRDILSIYQQILIFRYVDFFSQMGSILHTNRSILIHIVWHLAFLTHYTKIQKSIFCIFLWLYSFHYVDVLCNYSLVFCFQFFIINDVTVSNLVQNVILNL